MAKLPKKQKTKGAFGRDKVKMRLADLKRLELPAICDASVVENSKKDATTTST